MKRGSNAIGSKGHSREGEVLIKNRALKLIHYVHGLMPIRSWDGTSAVMVDLVGGRKKYNCKFV